MRDPLTITLTGAAGQIGYNALFRIAAGDLLGPDQPVRLRLLEIPQAREAAEGTAMELQDGSFSLLQSVDVFEDPRAAFEGTQLGLMVGSSPRKQGQQRVDLLAANSGIFAEQGKALNEGAADDVRLVVVGNPANTNALTLASHAPDIPLERFSALTRLDHHRAEAQLALATGAPVAEVEGVAVWGNHSASQYPDLSRARVGGRPAEQALAEAGLGEPWITGTFIPTVANRGFAIIQARGGSSVASASHAMLCHARDWLQGTPEGRWTSMAVPADGSYGIQPGVVASFPVRCADGNYEIDHGFEWSDDARERIESSVAELREERRAVESLGLLGNRPGL